MSKLYEDSEYPELVRLKPAASTRPVKSIESIEQAGLVIDHAHAIAMYTSRSVPNVGPQGPPGHGFDTIIASCSDEFTPLVIGGPKTTFRAPYPLDMTNGYVRISLTTAPVGSALIVDLTMNGTTVFSTLVQIDETMKTSVGSTIPAVLSIAGNSVPDDAEFLVYITQVGSTTAGTGLKIAVTGEKVP